MYSQIKKQFWGDIVFLPKNTEHSLERTCKQHFKKKNYKETVDILATHNEESGPREFNTHITNWEQQNHGQFTKLVCALYNAADTQWY